VFAQLTLQRFSLSRSFRMPIAQLEGARGAAQRARRKLLNKRTRNYAVWLTVVCAHLEFGFDAAIDAFRDLLSTPLPGDSVGMGLTNLQSLAQTWTWEVALTHAISVSLIEPFYVCAGFALYLNRRTMLEGWDLEVRFRRIVERLGRTAAAITLCFVLAIAAAPDATWAKPQEGEAKRAAKEVLQSPDFGHYVDDERWVYTGKSDDEKPKQRDPARFVGLANALQIAAWIAGAILVVALLVSLWRRYERVRPDDIEPEAPEQLFGFDLRRESLPQDVSAEALELVREGRLRDALALLYRASLYALIHRHGVALRSSHTEDDCLRLAAQSLDPESCSYFGRLVDAWRRTAYAGRLPAAEEVESYGREWSVRFENPAPPGASA